MWQVPLQRVASPICIKNILFLITIAANMYTYIVVPFLKPLKLYEFEFCSTVWQLNYINNAKNFKMHLLILLKILFRMNNTLPGPQEANHDPPPLLQVAHETVGNIWQRILYSNKPRYFFLGNFCFGAHIDSLIGL
jgi:hypothetical protein